METIKYEIRTAKKEHHCEYCGRKIKVGDKYNYSFNVDDGDHWELKECIFCNYIIPHLIDPRDLSDGVDLWCISDAIYEMGIELNLVEKGIRPTNEVLQKLSHDLAYHYGFGKKDKSQ